MTQLHHLVQTWMPHLHGHQSAALAALSLGMCVAKHCHLSRCALAVPRPGTQPASTQRRFGRLLHNPRLSPRACALEMSAALLQGWHSRRIVLLLDETPLANELRVIKVSLCYAGRALPLVWKCYSFGHQPASQPRMTFELLARLARVIPSSCEVVLLADRGFCWPRLTTFCKRRGWHWVIRARRNVHVRLTKRFPLAGADAGAGAEDVEMSSLAPRAGTRCYGSGEAFKKAGWR